MAYDSQYAHEYYMKHRQLKGRKKGSSTKTTSTLSKESTAGLSKEQKAQLKTEWERIKADLADEKEAINEAKKEAIDSMNEKITSEIKALREAMKNIKDNPLTKDAVKRRIEELKGIKKEARTKIQEAAKSDYNKQKEKAYSTYNAKVKSMKK